MDGLNWESFDDLYERAESLEACTAMAEDVCSRRVTRSSSQCPGDGALGEQCSSDSANEARSSRSCQASHLAWLRSEPWGLARRGWRPGGRSDVAGR